MYKYAIKKYMSEYCLVCGKKPAQANSSAYAKIHIQAVHIKDLFDSEELERWVPLFFGGAKK